MRKILSLLALCTALPAFAQNTDIESLSGLQFNFGNPGARSLGMGGAFLGLADDASAAEANPAGLTILRKPEISIEIRNYVEQQTFTTTGEFPNLTRTDFNHYSQRAPITFASAVIPYKNATFGAYYHEALRNVGSGEVVPIRNPFTGAVTADVPIFFFPRNGTGPVSRQECIDINVKAKDDFACLGYPVLPFLSAVDVTERTFGIAAAYKIGNFSFGGTVRYQRFNETAFTFRVTPEFDFSSISVQASSDIRENNDKAKDVSDITFAGGVKWTMNDRFSAGAVYKQGARYKTPLFIANDQTNFEFAKVADTTFHVPDTFGAGVSFRPIPVLTVNADAVRVKYSNLVDDFFSINASVREVVNAYKANDVTELHLGAEYFFSTKIPLALRVGYWRDPAHSIEYSGPLNTIDRVGAAILYPHGESQNHRSIGAGLAWPRFQIDAAYDTSPHYKVASVSMVTRF